MTPITPELLLQAYAVGLFPMAESAKDPTLHWIDPEERGIIPLSDFHIPRSLKKSVLKGRYEIRIDTAFARVINACAERTDDRRVTWINATIKSLYIELQTRGHCHSVEAWEDNELVGGLYGVKMGAAFFGESMFSRRTDASKVALVHLVARLNAGGFSLLDAQFMNDHLVQFGTLPVTREQYKSILARAVAEKADFKSFAGDSDRHVVVYSATHGPSLTQS